MRISEAKGILKKGMKVLTEVGIGVYMGGRETDTNFLIIRDDGKGWKYTENFAGKKPEGIVPLGTENCYWVSDIIEILEEKKFKEGDTIRMKENCNYEFKGDVRILHCVPGLGGLFTRGPGLGGCHHKEKWELVKTKVEKEVKEAEKDMGNICSTPCFTCDSEAKIKTAADTVPETEKWSLGRSNNKLKSSSDEKDKQGITNMLVKFTAKVLRTFSPDKKALFKAGFIEETGEWTKDAWRQLRAMILDEREKELIDLAHEIIKEKRSEKKDDE